MRIKSFLVAIISFTMMVSFAFAQSETVFSGVPRVKISEGGVERLPEELSRKQGVNLRCVISA